MQEEVALIWEVCNDNDSFTWADKLSNEAFKYERNLTNKKITPNFFLYSKKSFIQVKNGKQKNCIIIIFNSVLLKDLKNS